MHVLSAATLATIRGGASNETIELARAHLRDLQHQQQLAFAKGGPACRAAVTRAQDNAWKNNNELDAGIVALLHCH
jgi:hypothetical protein